MATSPTDIANQSLDAIGSVVTIADIESGPREAQICLRAYSECRKQLLRAALWDFARKQAPLFLLADSTGQTAGVGTMVPFPWTYEYAYPTDALRMRFVPQNPCVPSGTVPGNIAIPNTPLSPQLGQPPTTGMRIVPARFLVANDFNNPPPGGAPIMPGTAPTGRTVVLTNVKQAIGVYTADVAYPSLWDSLFRAALVAYIASEIALPIWSEKDRKFGMAVRAQQVAIAKQKITEARVASGNEGVTNTDIIPDYIRARRAGLARNGSGDGWLSDGQGVFGYGWDCVSFGSDGAF